ncbi:Putative auto-transporter adhesin, head GIN domain [Chitinophaga sp. CF118]|uniref:head GIN domain-containing protein n=1 Tax=Chitinophaga sp. CF118 TaxID=1884367 RepID=UPI0008E30418|nr:head GIN domain-containing protein [Chitinophaga sp. CF118]SFE28595.1 Putative auto-transporter adhesin, head GIN domain [Chitinophaga sp. CF118]
MYTVKKQTIIVYSSLGIGWLLLMLFIFSFILSGCSKEVLAGSGMVITEQRPTGNFTDVTVDGPFYVHLQQAADTRVEIIAENNLMRVIETEVRDSILHIRLKKGVRLNFFKDIHINLKNTTYHSVDFSGSGNIDNTDTLHTAHFAYAINGSGNARFTLETIKLETTINGSGSVNLCGSTSSYNSDINGSGDINGLDLLCSDASISVKGSGGHTLSVSHALDVSIHGSGNVKYKGSPTVNSDIQGSGRVIKL